MAFGGASTTSRPTERLGWGLANAVPTRVEGSARRGFEIKQAFIPAVDEPGAKRFWSWLSKLTEIKLSNILSYKS
jgi:hypothetical protein